MKLWIVECPGFGVFAVCTSYGNAEIAMEKASRHIGREFEIKEIMSDTWI